VSPVGNRRIVRTTRAAHHADCQSATQPTASRRYIAPVQWRALLKRSKSGAKATALQTLSRSPGVVEFREASGLRRVHRRFSLSSPARLWLPMAVQIKPHTNMNTYTKSIALAALALALAGSARSADTTVTGKWQGEFDSQVGHQQYTYEFKVDGTNVTGRALGIRDEGTNNVAITEGKIIKDEISFVEPLKFDDNDIRIEYTGKVSGDEIKLHRKVGDFGEEDLVAKRVKEAEPKAEVKPEAKAETKPGTNSPAAKP
jgi:hypothetical protein